MKISKNPAMQFIVRCKRPVPKGYAAQIKAEIRNEFGEDVRVIVIPHDVELEVFGAP